MGHRRLRNISDISVTTAEWDMAESHNFLSEGRHLVARIPGERIRTVGQHVAVEVIDRRAIPVCQLIGGVVCG